MLLVHTVVASGAPLLRDKDISSNPPNWPDRNSFTRTIRNQRDDSHGLGPVLPPLGRIHFLPSNPLPNHKLLSSPRSRTPCRILHQPGNCLLKSTCKSCCLEPLGTTPQTATSMITSLGISLRHTLAFSIHLQSTQASEHLYMCRRDKSMVADQRPNEKIAQEKHQNKSFALTVSHEQAPGHLCPTQPWRGLLCSVSFKSTQV